MLETLARKRQPSRAEVTDAATAVRAECVMLNKGPYIGEAITALDSILTRMQDHQDRSAASVAGRTPGINPLSPDSLVGNRLVRC